MRGSSSGRSSPSLPETRNDLGRRRDAADAGDAPPETVAEPPPGVPRAGELVGERYRVERLLGSGGMAHVLAARHVQLGHAVAIKVLDPTLGTDADAKERFGREARAMAALRSKHTVRVHDVGTLPSGLPFMVMELLEGRDLSRLLAENGPLPLDAACAYIEQACEAVDEAHEAGLVHRDLKPQNLFLANVHGGPPIVRVLDFGIARAIGGRHGRLQTITRIGDVVGTLSYMAPEQIKSSRSVDRRADVWSLGACLYRLVTGSHPFVATPEPALVEVILTASPRPMTELRPEVPAVLESVVMRCLRKAPDERFPTAGSLRSALAEVREVMAVEPFTETTDPGVPGPDRSGRPSSRAMKVARERLRASDPAIALTARELAKRTPYPKHDTTAPMPRPGGLERPGGVVPTAAGAPMVPARPTAVERGVSEAAPRRGSSTLVLVLIALLVAALVVIGGLFVLTT